jgi:hypothetical protein
MLWNMWLIIHKVRRDSEFGKRNAQLLLYLTTRFALINLYVLQDDRPPIYRRYFKFAVSRNPPKLVKPVAVNTKFTLTLNML